MLAVGIKVLKNRLSEYVRLAAGGETVLVLDRNRVVAELNPPRPANPVPSSDEDWKARGVREGWLTLPTHKMTGAPRNFPTMTLEELLADLDEARSDRDIPR
ncbi:MAG: prevent-host-death protein [Acidobacteria bacterium]|nr:MAG: prevent-host-death protein [Acidobacteriota bacterium]